MKKLLASTAIAFAFAGASFAQDAAPAVEADPLDGQMVTIEVDGTETEVTMDQAMQVCPDADMAADVACEIDAETANMAGIVVADDDMEWGADDVAEDDDEDDDS
jgi:hypothetical protein